MLESTTSTNKRNEQANSKTWQHHSTRNFKPATNLGRAMFARFDLGVF